jgi:hypothetical protein
MLKYVYHYRVFEQVSSGAIENHDGLLFCNLPINNVDRLDEIRVTLREATGLSNPTIGSLNFLHTKWFYPWIRNAVTSSPETE